MPATFPDGLPALLPATVAQVQRRLPAPGELKVRLGSRVEPEDVIGQCTVVRQPLLLDIATALKLKPQELPERMKPAIGAHVVFRDVLARSRFGGRTVLAPLNGTLTAVDRTTGFITLTPDPEPASVTAAVRGYVASVDPQRSATIETAAAVVQGLFGCGSEQWGLLRLIVTDPADMITADMIDARSAFTIIIGGAGITADALRKAQAEQVRGVIVGSIEASELRAFMGPQWRGDWQEALTNGVLPLPSPEAPTLLITEGFGSQPMSRPTYDLLTRFDRQEGLLQGQTKLDSATQRARLVIPLQRLPGGEAAPTPSMELRVGSIVRVASELHRGAVGKVVALSPTGRLPSGIRTATATVQISPEQRVALPQSVLHIFE